MSSLIQMDPMLPIGEKRKLLYQFVDAAKEHEVTEILKDCQEGLPSTQYNWLKLLLGEKFSRFDLMMELLYDGDTAILNGVVSKWWLYEDEENSLINSDFLLNKLFPNVSHICRQKVLYKIGRYVLHEAKVDGIWNAVEQRYGFDVAFPLLQACSKAKISSVLDNRIVVLSGYQVVQILQKYPDIGLDYFKNNDVKASKMNPHCSPLHYLYKYRFDDFLDLSVNHSDKFKKFKFGRCRSTKMIRAHRAKLLEQPYKTITLLKLDRIRREFSNDEFQTLLESTLSRKPENVENMWKWVKTVPLYKRIDMVNQAFTKKCKINLAEHPKFMDVVYMFLLPEEKKLSAIEWKMENDTSYGWSFKGLTESNYESDAKKRAWLQLKPISHSVPELQKLLLIEQDVNKRAVLSKYLIQTCYINDDLPQLLKVLELLSQRSRNDRVEVREKIFTALAAVMDKMQFSREHWDIIIEMIQMSLIFKDKACDRCYKEKQNLIDKAFAVYLKSDWPADDLLTMLIKLKIQCNVTTLTYRYQKDFADRRTQLESYMKEFETLQLANGLCGYDGKALSEPRLKKHIISLIKQILELNGEAKEYDVEPILISSHPWLRRNLERIAKEEEALLNEFCEHPGKTSFSWKVFKKFFDLIQQLKEEQNLIVDAFHGPDYIFSKQLHFTPKHTVILHFLQTNPSHLTNWSANLSKMLETRACVSLMRKLKACNYSTLIDQAITKCSEIIRETSETNPEVNVEQKCNAVLPEVNVKRKCNAVLVLSVLQKASDFLALVSEFYPPEKKVDVVADKSGDDYEMRKKFAKSLINIDVPQLTFEAIKTFCVGDYLKLTIGSLYSQLSRAPSVKSLDFLREKLTNVPVSLQKHMIRLYCAISSMEEKGRVLREVESTNVSVRYEMFLQASKLLRSSPSHDKWTILKSIIESTTADDASILEFIHSTPNLHTCPLEYISEYVDTILTVLRKLEPTKVRNFTERIGDMMNKIPGETLDGLLMYDYENQDNFSSTFCVKYLQFALTESILEHRLSNVWCILNNVIGRGWDREYDVGSYDDDSCYGYGYRFYSRCNTYPTRTLVLDFISTLSSDVNDSKRAWSQCKIFRTLIGKFEALSAIKFTREILYLNLALLLIAEVDCRGTERLRRVGRSLARFVDSLVETYGGEIIFIVQDTIKSYVQCRFSNEFSRTKGMVVELVDEILETSKSRQNLIISINFLHRIYPKETFLMETLEKIKKFFNESDDVIVQLYYASVDR